MCLHIHNDKRFSPFVLLSDTVIVMIKNVFQQIFLQDFSPVTSMSFPIFYAWHSCGMYASVNVERFNAC